ncbi:MAG: hypothetical protein R3D71_04565 [Rickettsiales bacterium]
MKLSVYIIITALSLILFTGRVSFAAEEIINKNNAPTVNRNAKINTGNIIYKKNNAAFDYQRTQVTILRKSMPVTQNPKEAMPWRKDDTNKIIRPKIEPLVFDVEMRNAYDFYKNSGWFNLSNFSEESGIMLVFNEPSIEPVVNTGRYSPVDILFIDQTGIIRQIVPNIVLANLEENIYPKDKTLAFLFLNGGIYSKFSVNVGDVVVHPIFKKKPVILNSPSDKSNNNDNSHSDYLDKITKN